MYRIKKINSIKSLLFFITTVLGLTFFLVVPPQVSGQPTYRLSGIGHNDDGSPIRNATIKATNKATNKTYPGKTNSNGKYTIGGLPKGTYQVDFIAPGYPPKTQYIEIGIRVTHAIGGAISNIIGVLDHAMITIGTAIGKYENSNEEIDMELNFKFNKADIIELQGTVKDSENKVIPNVKFKITRLSSNTSEEVIIDTLGNYLINNLDSGEYQIELQVTGYKTITEKLMIENGIPKTRNFELQKEN